MFSFAPLQAQGGGLDLSLSTQSLRFPTPRAQDFLRGWVDHPPILVQIEMNSSAPRPWSLSIMAQDLIMGGTKRSSDILYQVVGEEGWTPFSQTSTVLYSGEGATSLQLRFRLLLNWATDAPGNYLSNFFITLSPGRNPRGSSPSGQEGAAAVPPLGRDSF